MAWHDLVIDTNSQEDDATGPVHKVMAEMEVTRVGVKAARWSLKVLGN